MPSGETYEDFVTAHRGQLQQLHIPDNLWESAYLQIVTGQPGSKSKLQCARNASKLQRDAPTSWEISSSEPLTVHSDLFVLGHALTCDAGDQTRETLLANENMREAVWTWFDGELNVPEAASTSHEAALQVDLVMRAAEVGFPLALAGLVAAQWETINAIQMIEESGAALLQDQDIAPDLDLHTTDTYTWMQEPDGTLSVVVDLPVGVTKNDIKWELTPSRIHFSVSGAVLVEGSLSAPVDTEASTWLFRGASTVEIQLTPREGGRWRELIDGENAELRSSRYCQLHKEQKVQVIMTLMQTYYAQSYTVVQSGASGSVAQALNWYITEPLGLALDYVSSEAIANCLNKVFIHLTSGKAYSLLVPTKDIDAGEPLSCTRTSRTRAEKELEDKN